MKQVLTVVAVMLLLAMPCRAAGEPEQVEGLDELWQAAESYGVEPDGDLSGGLSGLALIATVGRGMVRSKGISARLFNALMKAGINVRLIDQGSSELNIIVGVDNLDFENAVRAIYRAFVVKENNRW